MFLTTSCSSFYDCDQDDPALQGRSEGKAILSQYFNVMPDCTVLTRLNLGGAKPSL